MVHALEHAVEHGVPGVYNVAGDGVLALSEVAGLLGKPYAPVLPPWGTGLAASVLRRLGVRIPPEALEQLRFGRGVDNRRYKAAGFHYQHTSRETVMKLGEHLRLHPVVRGAQEPYRYEREVEEFLRWSPHVRNTRGQGRDGAEPRPARGAPAPAHELRGHRRDGARRGAGADRAAEAERRAEAAEEAAREAAKRAARAEQRAEERRAPRGAPSEAAARPQPPGRPVEHYDDLAAEEVIALLASLEHERPPVLRDHERDHANRTRVLSAIESVLARRRLPRLERKPRFQRCELSAATRRLP